MALRRRGQEPDTVVPLIITAGLMILLFLAIFIQKPLGLAAGVFCLVLITAFFICVHRYNQNALREDFATTYWVTLVFGLLLLGAVSQVNPWFGIALGTLFLLGSAPGRPDPETEVRRGRKIDSAQNVLDALDNERSDDDDGIFWGGSIIPSAYATTHFLVIGTTGSGKTLTLRMLMASVLPKIYPGSGRRALLFDAKRDIVSILGSMSLNCKIVLLNPFDERCSSWNMAADITSPAQAQALADILVPSHRGEKDRFWRDAVATLLEGVVNWFIINAPGRWTLRDVVLAMRTVETLQAILSSDDRTAHFLDVLGEEKTAANVRATLGTKMRPYGILAACWHKAKGSISLQEWAQGNFILVLGEDEETKTAIQALNQLIFTRIAQMLLNKPETREPSTFIILDELPALGKLNMLKDLAAKGRSKGVSLALGFQDIEDLQQEYGKEEANTILGQCNCKTFLRLSSAQTAEWASHLFGEYEHMQKTVSESQQSGGMNNSTSRSTSYTLAKRHALLPSELLSIPQTNPRNGMLGFHLIDDRAYALQMNWRSIEWALKPPDPYMPNELKVPDSYQYLEPWTAADKARLGLSWVDML